MKVIVPYYEEMSRYQFLKNINLFNNKTNDSIIKQTNTKNYLFLYKIKKIIYNNGYTTEVITNGIK